MAFLFNIITSFLFYLILPFYFLERVISKKSKGWLRKFGFCDLTSGKVIMIHGCSVGEINAVGNLLKKIKQNFPEYKIMLTTSTITGQEVAQKKYSQIVDYITYFPFDTIFETNRFLKRANPSIVLIAETEIWPCFASACKQKNIPLFIINGRISDKSFGQYKFFSFYFGKILSNYTAIYTQSGGDAERFIRIGAKENSVEFMGNIKFNIEKQEQNVDVGQEGYRVLVAGSTHKNENDTIIETFSKLKTKFDNLRLIIAPRHLHNVERIVNLCSKYNLKFENLSSGGKFSDNTDVIIVDTIGELSKMYSICDMAYIGGSLEKIGGHNPLEACIYNKPVISGNFVSNFKDIYSILACAGAAKIVKNKNELYSEFYNILSDDNIYKSMIEACKTVFECQKGAVDFVVNTIRKSIRSGENL